MDKKCFISGKRSVGGRRLIHRGISKRFKGIGLKLVKSNKRVFKANLKKKTIVLNSGSIKKV
ncbi:50S ribosomal protein L28 [Candidatus Pinguicoccus supinus]|uniref:50S ribosomal protein L28 n=1 Tax=Candidatus Pinguicoccus supinus TaxID=2529394 RepID=A0A7T0BRM9_9BACT|nr:50S ribosomal protein L28 [Candidatus Pinguicoccus supinus]